MGDNPSESFVQSNKNNTAINNNETATLSATPTPSQCSNNYAVNSNNKNNNNNHNAVDPSSTVIASSSSNNTTASHDGNNTTPHDGNTAPPTSNKSSADETPSAGTSISSAIRSAVGVSQLFQHDNNDDEVLNDDGDFASQPLEGTQIFASIEILEDAILTLIRNWSRGSNNYTDEKLRSRLDNYLAAGGNENDRLYGMAMHVLGGGEQAISSAAIMQKRRRADDASSLPERATVESMHLSIEKLLDERYEAVNKLANIEWTQYVQHGSKELLEVQIERLGKEIDDLRTQLEEERHSGGLFVNSMRESFAAYQRVHAEQVDSLTYEIECLEDTVARHEGTLGESERTELREVRESLLQRNEQVEELRHDLRIRDEERGELRERLTRATSRGIHCRGKYTI